MAGAHTMVKNVREFGTRKKFLAFLAYCNCHIIGAYDVSNYIDYKCLKKFSPHSDRKDWMTRQRK